MLSNMPKSVFNFLAALTVAIPVVAWSTLPRVHTVLSQSVNGVEEHIGGEFTYHTATGGQRDVQLAGGHAARLRQPAGEDEDGHLRVQAGAPQLRQRR